MNVCGAEDFCEVIELSVAAEFIDTRLGSSLELLLAFLLNNNDSGGAVKMKGTWQKFCDNNVPPPEWFHPL